MLAKILWAEWSYGVINLLLWSSNDNTRRSACVQIVICCAFLCCSLCTFSYTVSVSLFSCFYTNCLLEQIIQFDFELKFTDFVSKSWPGLSHLQTASSSEPDCTYYRVDKLGADSMDWGETETEVLSSFKSAAAEFWISNGGKEEEEKKGRLTKKAWIVD